MAPKQRRRKTLKASVADDILVNQKVLHRVLTRIGFNYIESVGNGLMAVNRFEIVFMDLQMPVMDGPEAARLISDRHEGNFDKGPRVVFVTAHALGSV
jgi:CheY-like chemotaxis protein